MSNTCQEIADFLSERNISYRSYAHRPIFTVEDGMEIAKAIGVEPCKTLLLVNRQHQYYMLMTKGEGKISLPEVARQIGSSRLSFASADALNTLLHATPGAVSPLGLIFDYNRMIGLLIDKALLQEEHIVVHPCVNDKSYIFNSADFFRLFLPSVNRDGYTVIECGMKSHSDVW